MPRVPTLGDMMDVILTGPHCKPVSSKQNYWRLSYNPYCADTDSDETAIVYSNKDDHDTFLILYGDHRPNLKGLTLAEAKIYWEVNAECHGATSDRPTDE